MAQATILRGGAPVGDTSLVTADQVTILGSGTKLDPLRTAGSGAGFTFQAQNEGGALLPGMLVQSHGAFAPVLPPIGACVNAAATQAVGITLDASGAASHGTVTVQANGIVTLTTAQWDAVAGTSGGLNRGSTYYQSQTTPGMLSTTITTGQHQVVAGVALNSTELLLVISPPSIAP